MGIDQKQNVAFLKVISGGSVGSWIRSHIGFAPAAMPESKSKVIVPSVRVVDPVQFAETKVRQEKPGHDILVSHIFGRPPSTTTLEGRQQRAVGYAEVAAGLAKAANKIGGKGAVSDKRAAQMLDAGKWLLTLGMKQAPDATELKGAIAAYTSGLIESAKPYLEASGVVGLTTVALRSRLAAAISAVARGYTTRYGRLATWLTNGIESGNASVTFLALITAYNAVMQEQLGELHNLATAGDGGSLSEKIVPQRRWGGYQVGDWVTMRTSVGGTETLNFGMVVQEPRVGVRVASLATSEIEEYPLKDVGMVKQSTYAKLVAASNDLEGWVNLMLARELAEEETDVQKRHFLARPAAPGKPSSCPLYTRRRLMLDPGLSQPPEFGTTLDDYWRKALHGPTDMEEWKRRRDRLHIPQLLQQKNPALEALKTARNRFAKELQKEKDTERKEQDLPQEQEAGGFIDLTGDSPEPATCQVAQEARSESPKEEDKPRVRPLNRPVWIYHNRQGILVDKVIVNEDGNDAGWLIDSWGYPPEPNYWGSDGHRKHLHYSTQEDAVFWGPQGAIPLDHAEMWLVYREDGDIRLETARAKRPGWHDVYLYRMNDQFVPSHELVEARGSQHFVELETGEDDAYREFLEKHGTAQEKKDAGVDPTEYYSGDAMQLEQEQWERERHLAAQRAEIAERKRILREHRDKMTPSERQDFEVQLAELEAEVAAVAGTSSGGGAMLGVAALAVAALILSR